MLREMGCLRRSQAGRNFHERQFCPWHWAESRSIIILLYWYVIGKSFPITLNTSFEKKKHLSYHSQVSLTFLRTLTPSSQWMHQSIKCEDVKSKMDELINKMNESVEKWTKNTWRLSDNSWNAMGQIIETGSTGSKSVLPVVPKQPSVTSWGMSDEILLCCSYTRGSILWTWGWQPPAPYQHTRNNTRNMMTRPNGQSSSIDHSWCLLSLIGLFLQSNEWVIWQAFSCCFTPLCRGMTHNKLKEKKSVCSHQVKNWSHSAFLVDIWLITLTKTVWYILGGCQISSRRKIGWRGWFEQGPPVHHHKIIGTGLLSL